MLDKSTKQKENRMCKNAIRNAGMKQDDTARVLNVSQSVVSRPLKEHRESGSITKRKRSTLILECKEFLLKVVRDPCQKITFLLLKSKSVRVIVPESCF